MAWEDKSTALRNSLVSAAIDMLGFDSVPCKSLKLDPRFVSGKQTICESPGTNDAHLRWLNDKWEPDVDVIHFSTYILRSVVTFPMLSARDLRSFHQYVVNNIKKFIFFPTYIIA